MPLLQRIVAWLHRQVHDVPPEVAVCEFDCRQIDCRHGDWETCDRRLHPGAYPEAESPPEADRAS